MITAKTEEKENVESEDKATPPPVATHKWHQGTVM